MSEVSLPSPIEVTGRLRASRPNPRVRAVVALAAARGQAIHLVGGAVRDILLGIRRRADYDYVVARGAADLARAFADSSGGSLVPLDAERGIARVVVGREVHDFSDFQRPTLEADLAARDFTINAMAVPLGGEMPGLVDPCGGVVDLCGGVLRSPSPDVLQDDPLRMLRAFRFQATLGFTVEAGTREAIARHAMRLTGVAGERIREELFKILAVEDAWPALSAMESLGVLDVLFPEVAGLRGLPQGGFHHLDAYDHSLLALHMVEEEALPSAHAALDDPHALVAYLSRRTAADRGRRELLKLGALLHDIGKQATRRDDAETGKTSYPGHEKSGATMVDAVAERLCLSRVEARALHGMVRWHLRPLDMPPIEDLAPREVRRYFAEVGDAALETLILAVADSAASRGPSNTPQVRAALHRRVAHMLTWFLGDGRRHARPLLKGDAVAAVLGLQAGPDVGQWVARLQDAQVDGQVRTREEAEAWLQREALRLTPSTSPPSGEASR